MSEESICQRISQYIFDNLHGLADQIYKKQEKKQPALFASYTKVEREFCQSDTINNLSYFAQAIKINNRQTFKKYIYWLAETLLIRNVPLACVSVNLETIEEGLLTNFTLEEGVIIKSFIQEALDALQDPKISSVYVKKEAPFGELALAYLSALLKTDRRQASLLISNAVWQKKIPIKDVYLNVFQPVLYEVGRLWQANEIGVAREHYSTAVTQFVMSQLYPYIFSNQKNGMSMIATCVGNEQHEIGIRMVAEFFEMEGWDTYFLGANTPAMSIIQLAKEKKAQVLAVSATLTPHLIHVEKLIDELRKSDVKEIKIIVGGNAFNLSEDAWQGIGADGYAADALGAIHLAEQMVLS